MKGELAAKIVGLESILSRLASLEETVLRATQDRGEQSQALSDENQRLLARNEYLEAELRKQKEVVAAYQSSTEHQVSLSNQKSSYPQLPSLLGDINDKAKDNEWKNLLLLPIPATNREKNRRFLVHKANVLQKGSGSHRWRKFRPGKRWPGVGL